MPDLPRPCKWHACQRGQDGGRATFTPTRPSHEFCSTECRAARAAWRQRRGSVLVDMLIDGRWADLRRQRDQLEEEITK
ncbi:hypothetical protein DVVG_00024 [Dunaliella viridis virus SI2]|uniref:hypothetical protein n=1 Tax=Dunaliella viridis virus SI2 TaxID=754069 RepID=UPI0002C13E96|nr:hypothetical protein DVVG_00024 [Dunaliella viridis virus SI2]AGH16010.1 hypothetical protein DVVG_00024 [Dunaliella viridis virus SI2]